VGKRQGPWADKGKKEVICGESKNDRAMQTGGGPPESLASSKQFLTKAVDKQPREE